MGALIGIRVMGGSGPPSSVITSLGPALGPGRTGELEPGAWGPGLGPGLGPRKLKHKESQSVSQWEHYYYCNIYPNLYMPGYCWLIIALAFAISCKHSQSVSQSLRQFSPL